VEHVLRLLEKDIIRNCNIINFIEQYPIDRIEIMGKSVLVRVGFVKDRRIHWLEVK
jgi:hypothetical protein